MSTSAAILKAFPLLFLFGFAAAAAGSPEIEKRSPAAEAADYDRWLALGKRMLEQGKSEEAEVALKKALALKPGDLSAESGLIEVYDELGRYEEELPLLRRRVEVRKESLYPLAQLYVHLGRFEEAKRTFAQARAISGKTTKAYIQEGYFDLYSGNSDEARKDMENGIAVDTASPFGYHHMGTYLSDMGRYSEAEEYFRRALRMLEADPRASAHQLLHTRMWLSEVVQSQGRHSEAEAILLECLEKAPADDEFRPHVLLLLANVYASEGDAFKAQAAYERGVAACGVGSACDPADAVAALIGLGRFQAGRGRRDEAQATAARAARAAEGVSIGGGLFGVLGDLADLYASLGDVRNGEALHRRLLPMRRTMPFNPELDWVETGLAGIDAASGRLHEAEDLERRAIAIRKHNGERTKEADALDALAALYEKDGKRRAADEARERARALRGP